MFNFFISKKVKELQKHIGKYVLCIELMLWQKVFAQIGVRNIVLEILSENFKAF